MVNFESYRRRVMAFLRMRISADLVTTSQFESLADMEKRAIATTPEKLYAGQFHPSFGGTLLIYDDHPKPDDLDFTPPVKDFSKAKTKKEQLASQLKIKKKVKVSPLLAKLVS